MHMLLETEKLDELSLNQQIELLEKLSAVLEKNAENYPSPQWHLDVLESRKASLAKPDTWLSLEEAKKRLS
ncbi:MAG: hypothetical protein CO158_07115 [Piscirickettsiaceae bacterium CG_4_9_14_3_um_filter_43_564]|nr:MAG: hypothetical protein COW74_05335 [Piscirickettsiaceae bacterium CG18_big_fil_WC_8_21_14_2_50_44_103]PJA65706.1 MAG: hypothetical protein CO158_07115 [Piscirickettsiaceae bacterium CG_4_9_14_3_um_filter_43_564]